MADDPVADHEPDSSDVDLPELDEGLAGIANILQQVLELGVGHRASLRTEGFSEEAAEAMTVSIYGPLTQWFFAMLLKPASEEPT